MKKLVIAILLTVLSTQIRAESLYVSSLVGKIGDNKYLKITIRDLTPTNTEREVMIGRNISNSWKIFAVGMNNTSGNSYLGLCASWAQKGTSASLYHYEGLASTSDKQKLVVCCISPLNKRFSLGLGVTITKIEKKDPSWIIGPLLTYKASKNLTLSVQPTMGSDGKNRNFLMISSNL